MIKLNEEFKIRNKKYMIKKEHISESIAATIPLIIFSILSIGLGVVMLLTEVSQNFIIGVSIYAFILLVITPFIIFIYILIESEIKENNIIEIKEPVKIEYDTEISYHEFCGIDGYIFEIKDNEYVCLSIESKDMIVFIINKRDKSIVYRSKFSEGILKEFTSFAINKKQINEEASN